MPLNPSLVESTNCQDPCGGTNVKLSQFLYGKNICKSINTCDAKSKWLQMHRFETRSSDKS